MSWRLPARPLTPSWNSTSRGRWRRTPSPWSTCVGFVVRLANLGMSAPTTLRSGSSNRTLEHFKTFQRQIHSNLIITLLESWQQVHHLKIVRSCPYCGMDQTSRGGLRQHISRKHREEHRLAKGLKSSGRIRSSLDQPMAASLSSLTSPPPTTVGSLLQNPQTVPMKSEGKEETFHP